ncbi:hypothetical protein pW2_18 [Bacillus phage pW2]|uniref:Uncharacterized protein n=1 Tax=Bacillus phage pW2 TaxID=2500559 RepID=A0A3T0IHG3_9CAUD|nr:hypothetical protein PQE69_gp005 [Bacillus phage pW2]AZU98858.1 hypothetical protein pW2_18 [Bacillus phage pW2]
MIWKRKKKFIMIWFEFHLMQVKRSKKHLWHMAIGKCPHCDVEFTKPVLLHQNCAYVDELSNYYWLCGMCHEYIYERYQDMWDEYNASRY